MTGDISRRERGRGAVLAALVVLSVFGASVAFAGATAADGHDLEYTASDESADPGETVNVSINVTSALQDELEHWGHDINLAYDDDVLEYVGSDGGEYVDPMVNENTDGQLSIVQIIGDIGGGKETPLGPAFTLEFEAIGENGDVGAIEFEDVEAEGDSGTSYTVETTNGSVSVGESAPWYEPYVDDEGVVDTLGLQDAIGDWSSGDLETSQLQELIGSWSSGNPV